MEPLQIPNTTTLDTVRSWCNSKGGIDRSACIELRVSELRRLAGCVEIDHRRRDRRGRPLHITRPLPGEKPELWAADAAACAKLARMSDEQLDRVLSKLVNRSATPLNR